MYHVVHVKKTLYMTCVCNHENIIIMNTYSCIFDETKAVIPTAIHRGDRGLFFVDMLIDRCVVTYVKCIIDVSARMYVYGPTKSSSRLQ